jgi:hypothetical protein
MLNDELKARVAGAFLIIIQHSALSISYYFPSGSIVQVRPLDWNWSLYNSARSL